MILAEELRIGNYVGYLEGFDIDKNPIIKAIIEVESIWHGGINVSGGYQSSIEEDYSWKQLIGIPLTPDVLEKLGVNKYNISIEFDPRMEIRFHNCNPSECDLIQDGKYISFKYNHIKYLHQLQNLYFILSGKELQYQS